MEEEGVPPVLQAIASTQMIKIAAALGLGEDRIDEATGMIAQMAETIERQKAEILQLQVIGANGPLRPCWAGAMVLICHGCLC